MWIVKSKIRWIDGLSKKIGKQDKKRIELYCPGKLNSSIRSLKFFNLKFNQGSIA
jgi:hypothetical protein